MAYILNGRWMNCGRVCVCVCTLLAPTEATVYVNGEVVLIDGERVAAVGTPPPPPAVVHALDVTSHSYTRSLRSFFQALLLLLLLFQLIHSVPDFLFNLFFSVACECNICGSHGGEHNSFVIKFLNIASLLGRNCLHK